MRFNKALQHTIYWKVLNTMLTFLINVLLVRMLGAAFSGPFFYTVTALSFLVLLLSWSLESGITYYGSKNTGAIAPITKLILPCMLVQALVCMLLLQFIPLQIDSRLAFIYILSNLAILYFTALFSAQKWFVSLNIIFVLANAVLCTILLYQYFFMPAVHVTAISLSFFNPSAIYVYSSALQAIVLIAVFFIKKSKTDSVQQKDAVLVKNIFKYATIAFTSNLLFFLVTRADYFFVQKYCTATALSNYIQVSKFGQLLLFLPSMIAIVIFPYTSGDEEDRYLEKVQFFCRMIVGCFIPLLLVIVSTGYWIFPWLFGADFTAMYPAMLFYFTGFFCLSMVTVLASYLAGKALLSANLKATVIALVIVVVGDVIAIPLWGINAAAAVSSIAYLACLVYLLWVFTSAIGCSVTDFFAVSKNDMLLISNFINRKKTAGENI